MTTQYAAALEAHNVAFRAFDVVRTAYRNRQVGDAEFLAARAKYDLATKAYDVAFDAEAAMA